MYIFSKESLPGNLLIFGLTHSNVISHVRHDTSTQTPLYSYYMCGGVYESVLREGIVAFVRDSGVFCESILVFESIIVFVRECNGVFESV